MSRMSNFKSIEAFIDRENVFAEILGNEKLPMNPSKLNKAQALGLFRVLDNSMSPENLNCDGEISAANARRKAKWFTGAIADLKTLGFEQPESLY